MYVVLVLMVQWSEDVCLTVEYVDGHEQPPRTFLLFKCTTRESDSHEN